MILVLNVILSSVPCSLSLSLPLSIALSAFGGWWVPFGVRVVGLVGLASFFSALGI